MSNSARTSARIPAAAFSPGWCHFVGPLLKRAQGKPGADCARSPMCVGVLQECTRVKPQVQPGHPGFPRAMVLRLIRALPGEAAVFATVADVGLTTPT